jgi:hypothetical protein
VAASWSFTVNCHTCTAIMSGAYIFDCAKRAQQPRHAAGRRDGRSTESKAPDARHGGRHAPAHWHARFTPPLQLFANAAIAASRVACSSIFRFEFLIRRPQLQILLLHNGRELVEMF